jgi:hypothetical protein
MGTNVRVMKAISIDLYKRLLSNQPALGTPAGLYGEAVQQPQTGYGNPLFDGLPSQLSIGDDEHPTTRALLASIPENQRARSKRLINLILASNKLTWGDNGEIKYHGKSIPKSNIVDLLSAATKQTKLRQLKMPGLKEFINFLKEVNVPKYFLGSDFVKLMDGQNDECQSWITYENSNLVK